MWLLHIRPNHVRRRSAQRALWSHRQRREGIDERQHLPMRCLSQHRRRYPAGSPPRIAHLPDKGVSMEPFSYVRATAASQATQAATDHDVRLIAGGPTLLDLMKLDVERPSGLVD